MITSGGNATRKDKLDEQDQLLGSKNKLLRGCVWARSTRPANIKIAENMFKWIDFCFCILSDGRAFEGMCNSDGGTFDE
jgi:hypothetical protein